jgi:hydrogenase expression/formation protein HypE
MSRDRIKLAHGSGGALMHELIARVIVPRFGGEILGRLEDAAELPDVGGSRIEGGRLAFTTDSYVVQPLFFPGGDIGKLAVVGTVNDLAVKGAVPACLTLALVIEEGFPIADLERVLDSAAWAARDAGVAVVAGDTKVVERGAVGGLIVNTAGIGVIPDGVSLASERVRDGDSVIVSGTIGDHETAIVIARKELRVEEAVESDCAAVHGIARAALDACPDVRVMRDPTRGGLGTTLNEIAAAAKAGIAIEERSIPIHAAVRAVCEILGFDPLYMACEGKVIAVVPAGGADAVVRAMRAHPLGREAAVIGTVGGRRGVYLRTAVGGVRPVVMLEGAQLPRIC